MMPSRRRLLIAALAIPATTRAATAATSANSLELRVDYAATSQIGAGERMTPGRLWRTRMALRHEGTQHGRALTIIARLDRNIGWLMMAEPRLAIETDLSALDIPLDVLTGGGGMQQIREGRERVNALDTTRIRVERAANSGASFTGRVWVTDQGVIARIDGEGESRGRRGRTLMNFRDVKIGPLDPTLFEAPRGVQLIRVRGGDLGTLLQGMEAAGQLGRPR